MMRLDLDGLADASREALMSEWRAVVGRPPPKHLSRPLMVQILSHAYQLETLGGYTKRLDGRLKSAALRDVLRPAFKPGSRFVREYHGITHVVEVGDDGRFLWNDQSFKSLSNSARAINASLIHDVARGDGLSVLHYGTVFATNWAKGKKMAPTSRL